MHVDYDRFVTGRGGQKSVIFTLIRSEKRRACEQTVCQGLQQQYGVTVGSAVMQV